jgi:hypothetical protein
LNVRDAWKADIAQRRFFLRLIGQSLDVANVAENTATK